MIGSQDDPASEHEPNVEEERTDEEPEHVGSSSFHGENEDIVGAEESQISQYSKPHQTVPCPQHQTEI